MSITTMTFPASARPRTGSMRMPFGGLGARAQATWRNEPQAPTVVNPIVTAVDAAKQGGPPRGVPR